MSFLIADKWANVPVEAPDAIFALSKKANEAEEPKANLVIGAYRDAEGYPYPLKCVRKAEQQLLEMKGDYEYLPFSGFKPLVDAGIELLYGDSLPRDDVVGVHTISGTGGLSVGAFFLASFMDRKTTALYLSRPTWPNHINIFDAAGWENIREYSYYDPERKSLDFEGYKRDILDAPSGSVFVVHACAHNPTGVDPSREQWEELVELYTQKDHIVFFDCAYLGYASGSLDDDAFSVRLFARKGLQFLCAQSFSKNLGLYSERVGVLSVVLQGSKQRDTVFRSLESVARKFYSCPPAHGARLAHLVLTDNSLRREWVEELRSMAERIHEMRQLVYDELQRLGTPGSWEHIVNQIGMFSFLGLTKEQCQYCIDHNVFITLTGRCNMAGLTEETAILLANTVDASLTNMNK